MEPGSHCQHRLFSSSDKASFRRYCRIYSLRSRSLTFGLPHKLGKICDGFLRMDSFQKKECVRHSADEKSK